MRNKDMARPSADDLDQYEEIAIAMAQSEMECVIAKSGLQRSEVAEIMGRPRSFISKIMNGGHNLTIRTMARLFSACGLELRFGRVPVGVAAQWGEVTLSVDNAATDATLAMPSEARAEAINVASAGVLGDAGVDETPMAA